MIYLIQKNYKSYIYLSNVCMCVCVCVCDRCTATPLVPLTPNLARRTISVLGRFKAGEIQDSRPQSRPRTLFSLARSASTAIRPQDVALAPLRNKQSQNLAPSMDESEQIAQKVMHDREMKLELASEAVQQCG